MKFRIEIKIILCRQLLYRLQIILLILGKMYFLSIMIYTFFIFNIFFFYFNFFKALGMKQLDDKTSVCGM